MEKVWEKEGEILHQTCLHKFRTVEDVNQYLFRFWQLCSGEYYPINTRKDTEQIDITKEKLMLIKKIISKQEKKIVCLHDECWSDFEFCKNEILKYFEEILPDKSSFEK